MIALIDGDEIVYKVCSKFEKKNIAVYRGDKFLYNCPNKHYAIESIGNDEDLEIISTKEILKDTGFENEFKNVISSILTTTNSNGSIICVSGDKNFRYNLASILPYKGNRDPSLKPEYFPKFKEYLLSEYKAEQIEFLEADDLMVINNRILTEQYGQLDSIICATDKDLRTVPSLNYNILKNEISLITPKIAEYNFYYQLLIGDPVDNIPHPFGLGDIAAKRLLDESSNFYQTVIDAYTDYLFKVDKSGEFKTKWFKLQNLEDILFEISNLLYMHRTINIDERWNLPEGDYSKFYEEKEKFLQES